MLLDPVQNKVKVMINHEDVESLLGLEIRMLSTYSKEEVYE